MTDEAEKQRGGRPRNLGQTEQITLTIPEPVHRYLTWLARHSMYGATVNEVAGRLLSDRAQEIFDSGLHNKQIPD